MTRKTLALFAVSISAVRGGQHGETSYAAAAGEALVFSSQSGAEDPCQSVAAFYESCLLPVIGPRYGALRFDMDVACQAFFWGTDVGHAPGLRQANCSARASDILGMTASSNTSRCGFPRATLVASIDFARTCTSRVGTHAPEPQDHRPLTVERSAKDSSISSARREATVAELMPSAKDRVHALWINGPAYRGKIERNAMASNSWPQFGGEPARKATTVDGGVCDSSLARYSGYASEGAGSPYCFRSSSTIESAQLLINSGWGGVVIDASMPGSSLITKLGAVPGNVGPSWRDVYSALPAAQLECTLSTESGKEYHLSRSLDYAVISPVRHGVVLSHVTGTILSWEGSGINITSIQPPQWWIEINLWSNSVSIQLGWDELGVDQGCAVCEAANVSMKLTYGNEVVTNTSLYEPGDQFVPEGVSLFVEFQEQGGASQLEKDLSVTSSSGTVVFRPATRDVVLEVSPSTPCCAYGQACSPLALVDWTVANDNTEGMMLRLSITRNFPSRSDEISGSQVGAEITGLSAVIRDTAGNPTGIPFQISKKWDETSDKAVYESRYDVTPAGGVSWWTIVMTIRCPAQSQSTLTLALAYNQYGGIPSFSHAQLSLIGYSDSWVWHQTSLGSLGENVCLDPLGIHARASVTDLRVELFDGFWDQNVGGGDWLVYFNESGSFVYAKALDPVILTSGPCLSNASFTMVTEDGAIQMSTFFSGGRTDDFTKHFFHIRYDVLRETRFSRLAFFQLAADWYQFAGTPAIYEFGSAADGSWPQTEQVPTNCTGKFSYPNGFPYRRSMMGGAPWYFSLKYSNDQDESGWGDRGLVVRSYDSVLGGAAFSAPAFSVFCDNLELSVPEAAGNELFPGDYVNMRLEIVVLPRLEVVTAVGVSDFDTALGDSESETLASLAGQPSTAAMVATHARGHVTVVPVVGEVESHYPVRVCASKRRGKHLDTVRFQVSGSALGFVPIVICGLHSHAVVAGREGLFVKYDGDVDFHRLDQSVLDATDFWQTNFDPDTGFYEVVFNVELLGSNFTEFSWPLKPQ